MPGWFKLGFTYEDVVGAWQDWRLAQEIARATDGATRVVEEGILESPGNGEHLVWWYVSSEAAALLDARQISWRRFLLASGVEPPKDAHPTIKPGAPSGSDEPPG